ncbi:chemotaxis protein CheW [Gammaproteobacteria bacterium AH-315-C21]|nr:chemotaxis protein CheW [Gammaproteobacteria bacterium]MBN4078463.1 chemotaxis protein CheW [Gammaproteobacteria bacterium AH-315-C21]PCH62725.1 MAG: chemotaxis protein CheW [Gammaproteobacteria bacterium]PCH64170.1 MAG: chemotaxis protein CheW [Gammaproteobacteria bacterium]
MAEVAYDEYQDPINQDIQDPLLQWVTFRLDEEKYGINVMAVQEVLKVTEITQVPGAPDFVLGIINLRGNVVTVIDARTRFKLGHRERDDNSRIIIIESSDQEVGILVDSVAEVVYMRDSEIEPAPAVGSDDSSKFIQGVNSSGSELLILVELDKLLSEHEWAEVAAL